MMEMLQHFISPQIFPHILGASEIFVKTKSAPWWPLHLSGN